MTRFSAVWIHGRITSSLLNVELRSVLTLTISVSGDIVSLRI